MSETEAKEEMRIDPRRAQALVSQLTYVKDRIAAAANGREVRLVAVSKLKPANDILALHQQVNHLHFGENYAQELTTKADLLPGTIRWHFIGGLQSTHCKYLAKIPNLFCVSSIDSIKKAQLLNNHRGKLPKINIHVQVNTSGESRKSGTTPGEETVSLCREIRDNCPNLNFIGLMTIGAFVRSAATTPEEENEDFVALREQRELVAQHLQMSPDDLELSMGMSADFEGAIKQGSSEVRIGSDIFGWRPAKADAQIVV
ncbi:Pyridoxal phosphate homeostasis protein [Cladobotryum mycophilum]|uniref:Pyridoxal phosphate homeostasis protein n=1 Tax=Cladobotryum mycophilum TaxID=491253 RepID=A0ABR0T243_9HYPO